MTRALLLLALIGCSTGSERSTPERPDFMTAPTRNQRITSIRFLPDDQVGKRLGDLQQVARTAPEAPVRDAVVLRLLAWGRPEALPVLRAMHRDDPDPRVARAALNALRDLCQARHGRLRVDKPPDGPIPDACTPVYDGTLGLPPWRDPPRLESAAFWKAHGVPTRTLPSGEVWAADEAGRERAFAAHPRPDGWTDALFDVGR